MCQLLAISSNREVDLLFSFREWRHRGDRRNPDGYGFALWENGQPRIVKKAASLFRAEPAHVDDVRAARSRIFICHVRFASVGARDGTNTHPFSAGLGGREFVFAHNGTVKPVKRRPLNARKPEGATDSEHAFLWMLERLAGVESEAFSAKLKELADEVASLGRFNFLLSDGKTLWAYAHDRLHFIERTPPYGGELVRLREDGYAVSLAEVKNPEERAVLAATEPLTDEPGWTRLGEGEIVVVRDGRVCERLG